MPLLTAKIIIEIIHGTKKLIGKKPVENFHTLLVTFSEKQIKTLGCMKLKKKIRQFEEVDNV